MLQDREVKMGRGKCGGGSGKGGNFGVRGIWVQFPPPILWTNYIMSPIVGFFIYKMGTCALHSCEK